MGERMTRAECDAMALRVLDALPDGLTVDVRDEDSDEPGSNGAAGAAMLVFIGLAKKGLCTHERLDSYRGLFRITDAGKRRAAGGGNP